MIVAATMDREMGTTKIAPLTRAARTGRPCQRSSAASAASLLPTTIESPVSGVFRAVNVTGAHAARFPDGAGDTAVPAGGWRGFGKALTEKGGG